MASTPDSMEALKVMTDYLDSAAKPDNTLEQVRHYGNAAICSGLMAVVYELRKLRLEMEKRR
jgi:hypothetical protein